MTDSRMQSGDQIRTDVSDFLAMSGVTAIDSVEKLKERITNCLKFVEEEIAEIKEVLDQGGEDPVRMAKIALETCDLIWTAHNISDAIDCYAPGLFDRAADDVRMANFTKFCATEEEALHTQDLYASGLHFAKMGQRIDTTVHEVSTYRGTVWAVVNADGKTMKSYKQRPVDPELLAHEYFS